MRQLEKQLEAKIVKYAKSKGCLSYKFTSPSQAGVPDRLFVYGGNVLFLEIKRSGKTPTKLQEFHLRKLKQAGVLADWVDNLEDAKICIDALLSIESPEFGATTLL